MLYVVATPIGNLEDITLRAARILGEVGLILAENPSQTKKLLDRLQVKTPVKKFFQHSTDRELADVIKRLAEGIDIAFVSDAGTPGISDPGGKLVDAAHKNSIPVVPIPGASSVTAVLSAAGIPAESFLFLGFLPKKKGRMTLFKELANIEVPVVLFESPERVVKTLKEVKQYLGDRQIVVGRELTKLHEEILRMDVDDAIKHFSITKPKGEFVIVIHEFYN